MTSSLIFRRIFILVMCLGVGHAAYADNVADIIAQKQAQIVELQNQIDDVTKQIADCNRQKKSWVAVAVVGGIGTAGTLAGAVFQGVKLNKLKKSGAVEGSDTGGEEK